MKRTPTPFTAAVAVTFALGTLALGAGCDDEGKSTPAADTAAAPATATGPVTAATAPTVDSDDDVLPEMGGGDGTPSGAGGANSDGAAATTAEPAPAPAPKAKTATPKPPAPKTPEVPKAPAPKATPPPAKPTPPPEPAPAKTKSLGAPKEGSADAVAVEIDEIFMPVKHFRARFDQKYKAKVHNTTKTSAGVLWVEKPDKLSLSYHDPNKNRAVSDGKILKVYEHENEQLFEKDVRNTEYPGAFAFILGKGLRQSFTFEFHKTTKWEGGPVLVGTPRVPNPGYKKVLFYIDEALLKKGDLGAVRRVLVLDAQGNQNRFDFVHAEEPKSIPDDKFEFTPPKGTQIIKG